jgi:hypothetical protein
LLGTAVPVFGKLPAGDDPGIFSERDRAPFVEMAGWSDFVFDERYKVRALNETEAFIKSERHHPGIPSTSDIADHAISVGEMQAKLLAKIEELTLNMIQQQKRTAAVKTENVELRNEIEALKRPASPIF